MTAHRGTRIDGHVHTGHSPDGTGTVRQVVDAAKARGLDGVAITDHNTIKGHRDIKAIKEPGFLLIPGIEISTAEGHCLGLGVGQAVPKGLGLAETIEAVDAAGGVAVPSHPQRRIHGVGPDAVRRCAKALSAIEVYNAHDGDRRSRSSELLAVELRLGGTGGSDAHRPQDVGHAYTTFAGSAASVEEALEWIRKGRSWGEGIPYRRLSHFRKNVASFSHWVGRGFRKI